MLSVSPASLAFTAGTAASQTLTLTTDFNAVSISSIVFPPGYTAQHPQDVEVAGPFTATSPLGDGIGFTAAEIIPGQSLSVPVKYSGVGTGTAKLRIVYNGVGGTYELVVNVTAS